LRACPVLDTGANGKAKSVRAEWASRSPCRSMIWQVNLIYEMLSSPRSNETAMKRKKPTALRDKRSAGESDYLQEEDTAWQT
ncbi:MAG: hypothetical protein OXK81_11070, partial [Chloroflexota bacterium]|nr:hypothetical protein [Chloroflexota bacterium]